MHGLLEIISTQFHHSNDLLGPTICKLFSLHATDVDEEIINVPLVTRVDKYEKFAVMLEKNG